MADMASKGVLSSLPPPYMVKMRGGVEAAASASKLTPVAGKEAWQVCGVKRALG